MNHELPACALGERCSETEFGGTALLVLNSTLPQLFRSFWDCASLRVFADGGANRVYELTDCPAQFVPDAVVGDLDSVRPDVLEFYRQKGAEVVRDRNQDNDDITKSIMFIQSKTPKCKVIIVGGLGGNITQELANFNAFFNFPGIDIMFVSDYNVIMSLGPGNHTITAPGRFGCGMLPFAGPCARATTTGLKWNVDGPLQFGGLISSSNEMMCTTVTVSVTHRIIWTFDLKTRL